MKIFPVITLGLFLFPSCNTTSKLSVPARFTEQADMLEVKGARSRHVSFGQYSTSKIKRGWLTRSSKYNRRFFPENLLLNLAGIHKRETIEKEKDKFSFSFSDMANSVEVFASEFEGNKTLNYQFGRQGGFPDGFSRLQEYQYFLTAAMITDTFSSPWQMILGNAYDRKADTTKNIFAMFDNTEQGYATNGKDTIEIRSLNLTKTSGPNGKEGRYPVKMLSGYELKIDGALSAVIDNIGKRIWFYKELEASDRLILGAIATTILVRRIKDVKW